MRGLYSDGVSARQFPVSVRLESKSLHIEGDGVAAEWPLRQVEIVHASPGQRVILRRRRGDARLTLSGEDEAALRTALPDLFRPRRLGVAMLATALIAVAAGTATFILYGAPRLAQPLAHMTPHSVETRMGLRSERMVGFFTTPCDTPDSVQADLDTLAARLTEVSSSAFDLRIRLVEANVPNAFALPGGLIIVTGDLLRRMETPEELAGVLSHEAAHIAERHVMAAVIRESGVGFMIDALFGGGSGAGREIFRAGAALDGLRHSRSAESEADDLAMRYLAELGHDPGGVADFFERLQAMEPGSSASGILSTHPESARRARIAREAAAATGRTDGYAPVMTAQAWEAVRFACGGDDVQAGDDAPVPAAPANTAPVDAVPVDAAPAEKPSAEE